MKVSVLIFTILVFACRTPDKRNDRSEASLITSTTIGKLRLGDNFRKIESYYDRVDTLEMESEGVSWPAKRVNLANGQWILAESTSGNGIIDRLHTNSGYFHTRSGCRVGQRLADVLRSAPNADVDLPEGILSVRLNEDSVSVDVDDRSEELFYKENGLELNDIRPEATISIISIY
jgi:hypothetical protein